MSGLPIAIADNVAQKRFIKQNEAFLLEYPKLNELSKKLFLRSLSPPDPKQLRSLRRLAEGDPAVVAFKDKMTAAKVVFYLGRMAVDDFRELFMLAANGCGFGAYKIVRGMYERAVTAFFIEKNPSEARTFAESSAIPKLNYLKRTFEASPGVRKGFSDESMATIEKNAAAAQAKRKQTICSRCHQPITQEAWTRTNLDVMAKAAAPELEVFYPQFYLEGTAQSHANMFGIERRLVRKNGRISYKETSEEEARFAVHLGHHLMVRVLGMQNTYFGLGFDGEVQARIEAFVVIWGRSPDEPPKPVTGP
jgi:hypothetical protein